MKFKDYSSKTLALRGAQRRDIKGVSESFATPITIRLAKDQESDHTFKKSMGYQPLDKRNVGLMTSLVDTAPGEDLRLTGMDSRFWQNGAISRRLVPQTGDPTI